MSVNLSLLKTTRWPSTWQSRKVSFAVFFLIMVGSTAFSTKGCFSFTCRRRVMLHTKTSNNIHDHHKLALGKSHRRLTNRFLSPYSCHHISPSALHLYSGIGQSSNEFLKKKSLYPSERKMSSTMYDVSSTMPHADIAVRLDQPILSPSPTQLRGNIVSLLKSLLTVLLSDFAKTVCITIILAFFITIVSKSSTSRSKKSIAFGPIISSVKHGFKVLQRQIQKFKEVTKKETEGIPMKFEKDKEGNIGWGVCTLASKKQIGRSKFIKYDFKLPKIDNVLNLALGQKISLCCLDNKDRVAKKDYYLFSPQKIKGSFSILVSKDNSENDGAKMAKGEGDFSKVLAEELEVGDEVALQPGPRTLSYRGQYLPVTDMVYVTSGSGIAPVLDQVKSVLPTGTSSVKSVSVIWINDNEEDFDVALSSLEDEYFKYSTKLAVSCVVKENNGLSISKNEEVMEALQPFEPGTMAVIAGPKLFSQEARSMLMGYGYPEECICVLP